ncbi:MAG: hypothetical protein RI935_488 [Candidatus Parcubacteria bacterium]|jgi:tRNA threonylcarbamoyladenosine biosynthesis protein TsaE
MKETFVVELEELEDLAVDVLDTLSHHKQEEGQTLLLKGNLGAGKTTFTKILGKALGIPEDEIHSPTFILKKEYKATHPRFKKLIHVDAYRFETTKEAKVLDLEKHKQEEGSLLVIEWPENAGIESGDMELFFDYDGDTTRSITIDYSRPDYV